MLSYLEEEVVFLEVLEFMDILLVLVTLVCRDTMVTKVSDHGINDITFSYEIL